MIITTLANKPRSRRKLLWDAGTHTRPDMTVEHVQYAMQKFEHIDIDVTNDAGDILTVRLTRAEAERIAKDIVRLLRVTL